MGRGVGHSLFAGISGRDISAVMQWLTADQQFEVLAAFAVPVFLILSGLVVWLVWRGERRGR